MTRPRHDDHVYIGDAFAGVIVMTGRWCYVRRPGGEVFHVERSALAMRTAIPRTWCVSLVITTDR